ncbi:PepSY domain-containing protein [uncultured Aureimonas sp.]|uniref:PepSY domain-containing protein n=1 Tax=uncultured Aureimonas sp. TaxID=1604662 RepID=UPI0025E56A5F|nr:PepSY domain-containing protein [uncultured Aureimonas sp.]
MSKPLRFSLALAATLLAATAPALSQTLEFGPNGLQIVPNERRGPDYGYDRPPERRGPPSISERQAARIARSEGMREIDDVFRQRRTYRVEGADRQGDDMTVIIDARTGDVIDVR